MDAAATFEPLGKFSYNQNDCINLECKGEEGRKIPTDGLVLKGCYTTITLAVYGNIIALQKLHLPSSATSTNNNINNNVGLVSSNDENNESDTGEVYTNNTNNFPHHNDFQDQNSSCDPTVSSTIADDLKEDEIPSASVDYIYSRSPSKDKDMPKNKREWSNSPEGSSYRSSKRSRVSGSYDSSYERRKPRTPPLQSPRISRPLSPTDSDDCGKIKEHSTSTENDSTMVGNEVFCPSSPSMNNNTPIESPTEIDEDIAELEPILSDDDISEDSNEILDVTDEMFMEEFYIKTFNPFEDELRKYEADDVPVDTARCTKVNEHLLKICENYETHINGHHEDHVPMKEHWVHLCEQIIQNLQHLDNVELSHVLKTVKEPIKEMFLSCIKIGLNYSLAIRYQMRGYNVRHIKAAIRLAECLADSGETMEWIIKDRGYNLFQHLMDLFPRSLIPMPIKLLIGRLIFQLIKTKEGIKQFLEFDGYTKVINMLSSVIDIRLLFTFKSILKKIHVYETLDNIKKFGAEIYEKAKANDEIDPNMMTDIERLFSCLLEARKNDVMHPKNVIPIATQFEVPTIEGSCDFVDYYRQHHLLEVMVLLWNVKHVLSPNLVLNMLDYIKLMITDFKDFSYMASNINLINDLTRILLEHQDELLDGNNIDVGLELCYKVEIKFHLDLLQRPMSNPDLTECVHSLYNLAVGPGRKYVLDFIAMDKNFLTCLNLIDKEKKNSMHYGSPGIKHKSPVLSYIVDIVDFIVRHVDDLDYLKKYDSVLLNLVKFHDSFEPSVAVMLQEMAVFLKPLEIEKVFEYNDITPLVELIKRSMEFLTTFPGDLIMTLRILRYLIVRRSGAEYQELKYDYYVSQLYSSDGATILLSILEKLTAHFDQPMIHSYLLGANQGVSLLHIVHPIIQILQKMLVQVIRVRNVEFKDVTAIETLMKTYALMNGIHPRCSSFKEAKEVQNRIIKILLTYTQSLTPDGMTTTNIHKSLWTQMIGEVIKYTLNGPCHFIPGLMVLSELLPLPLPVPIQCSELSRCEGHRLITERQLWSAHLHPQSMLITEIIQSFCSSSSSALLRMINRVCVQLSDLAPNMTLLVSKAVVEAILAEPLDENEGTAGLSRLIKFLANLLHHSSVKVSVLSILNGKLAELISLLLVTINDNNENHVRTQCNIFMVLQNLFDTEITMLLNSNHSPELILASGLPSKDLISRFVADAVDNFCGTSVDALTFAGIRAMLMLTDSDVTFSVLKKILISRKDKFVDRLGSIAEKCQNDRKHIIVIPALLDFFRSLIVLDPESSSVTPPRTIVLSTQELSNVLKWNAIEYKNGTKVHFLEIFLALISEPKMEIEDGETAEQVNDDVMKEDLQSLLKMLRETPDISQDVVATSESDITLPQAEGIVTQFSSRAAFYIADNLDELSSSYWIHHDYSAFDDDDVQPTDQVQCDLDELVRSCLPPDTNVASDCKRLLALSSSPQSGRDRNQSGICFRTRRVEVDLTPGRSEKKIFSKCKLIFFPLPLDSEQFSFLFLVPPRGRGFSRASAIRGDIFRSRPPNTSRPPSLHVDDFLAMEKGGQSNYNKRDIISAPRGRGRGSPFISRGRGISSYR